MKANSEISREERIIADNHRADRENGLSDKSAEESDAFERRVLGLPAPKARRPDGDWNDWGSNDY